MFPKLAINLPFTARQIFNAKNHARSTLNSEESNGSLALSGLPKLTVYLPFTARQIFYWASPPLADIRDPVTIEVSGENQSVSESFASSVFGMEGDDVKRQCENSGSSTVSTCSKSLEKLRKNVPEIDEPEHIGGARCVRTPAISLTSLDATIVSVDNTHSNVSRQRESSDSSTDSDLTKNVSVLAVGKSEDVEETRSFRASCDFPQQEIISSNTGSDECNYSSDVSRQRGSSSSSTDSDDFKNFFRNLPAFAFQELKNHGKKRRSRTPSIRLVRLSAAYATTVSSDDETADGGKGDDVSEQDKPRMVRSTSLKTMKERSGSPPAEKKVVRFADSLGLEMTKICTYQTNDVISKLPDSAFADLKLSPPLELSSCYYPFFRKHQSPGNNMAVMVPQFEQPGSDPSFRDKVQLMKVCLENTMINQRTVTGVVRTLNLGFQKKITVRYTTDGWKNVREIAATYVPHASDGGFSDRFSFVLSITHLKVGDQLVFCIKYEVDGNEYWDNNSNANYTIQCEHKKS